MNFGTSNCKCAKCDAGNSADDPNCGKNFTGSAKAMEADVGAELINNSKIKKKPAWRLRLLLEKKKLPKKFYSLADKNRELNKSGAIKHVKKCFSYAVSQTVVKVKSLPMFFAQFLIIYTA